MLHHMGTCNPAAPWCGTLGGYGRHKCRDDACRAANTSWHREWRNKRRQEPIPNHVHGTGTGYKDYGCRCEECTQAQADDQYRWWHKAKQKEMQ